MHGSPLLRAVLAFVVLLVLGVPLWRLTHQKSEAIQAPVLSASASDAKAIHLQLSFTQAPRGFKVLYLGNAVWTESSPRQDESHDLAIPFPPEGIDLQFEIDWPGDALCAARVQLNGPDKRTVERSIWGKGAVEEVVTFQ